MPDTILVPLADILDRFRPGSFDPPWTWDHEERHLLTTECMAHAAARAGVSTGHAPCAGGCYQRALEAHIAQHGLTQGVYLGSDGRVWDGHHRIVAARRLGLTHVPVELESPGLPAMTTATRSNA